VKYYPDLKYQQVVRANYKNWQKNEILNKLAQECDRRNQIEKQLGALKGALHNLLELDDYQLEPEDY